MLPTINSRKSRVHSNWSIREFLSLFAIIIIYQLLMQSETLFALIGKIRVQRIRLSSQPNSSVSGPWTIEEEIKFEDLIELYGPDFGLINTHFPTRSRKQIRKKYEEMFKRLGKKQQKMESRRAMEDRKNYFDQEILECNMIKWPKKPNMAESSSSDDSS